MSDQKLGFAVKLALLTAITAAICSLQPALLAHGQLNPHQTTGTQSARATMSDKAGADMYKMEPVGLVLSISGEWIVKSGAKVRALKSGDSVPNGWVLSGPKAGSIVIVLTDGRKVKCPGDIENNSAISINGQQKAAGDWLSGAIRMFSQRPATWVVAESRGVQLPGQDVALKDEVLKVDSGRVDLAPALSSVNNGKYFLRLYKLGADGNSVRLLGPEPVSVQKGKPVLINQPEPGNVGIYKVSLSVERSEPLDSEGWLLVCDSKHYAACLPLFEKARSACEDLKPEATPKLVRGLLRAYMAVLSDSTGK